MILNLLPLQLYLGTLSTELTLSIIGGLINCLLSGELESGDFKSGE